MIYSNAGTFSFIYVELVYYVFNFPVLDSKKELLVVLIPQWYGFIEIESSI